jgi:hypothetical protein
VGVRRRSDHRAVGECEGVGGVKRHGQSFSRRFQNSGDNTDDALLGFS